MTRQLGVDAIIASPQGSLCPCVVRIYSEESTRKDSTDLMSNDQAQPKLHMAAKV